MRLSVAVPTESPNAGAVASITLSKTPQNFLQAAKKAKSAQDKREGKSGVQPVIEKVADQPAENDRSHKRERKLDRQRRVRSVFLHLLLVRRQRLGLVGWIQFVGLRISRLLLEEQFPGSLFGFHHSFDERNAQFALFEFQNAIDRAPGRRSHSVLE
jgi:hypothetical protein